MRELDQKHRAKLRTHWNLHAVFPSIEMLCWAAGLAAKSSVFALVGRRVSAGWLRFWLLQAGHTRAVLRSRELRNLRG